MKEQNENRSKGVILGFRPALNPPHLGRDEFKYLGQASSELFAKLGNKSKVGASWPNLQPPSKMTSGGESNVIYLKISNRNNLQGSGHNDETNNNNTKDDLHGQPNIFE